MCSGPLSGENSGRLDPVTRDGSDEEKDGKTPSWTDDDSGVVRGCLCVKSSRSTRPLSYDSG